MSQFIELTRPDGCAILLNKYHITLVTRSVTNNTTVVVRLNNGLYQEVTEPYEEVKAFLEEKTYACK